MHRYKKCLVHVKKYINFFNIKKIKHNMDAEHDLKCDIFFYSITFPPNTERYGQFHLI